MTLAIRKRVPQVGLSLFDDAFGLKNFFHDFSETGGITPVNVNETEKEVTVTVEVPGINKKDIHIEYKEHILTVSGEKQVESAENGYSEILQGKFSRSVQLNTEIDYDKASAKQDNGILVIKLPKAKVVEAKMIKIN